MQNRLKALQQWIKSVQGHANASLTPLAGDASFRRYFRLQHQNQSWVVMDAPVGKESLDAFIHVANLLKTQGLCVPTIHAVDKTQGFALLDDLGDHLLWSAVTTQDPNPYYQAAMHTLLQLQRVPLGDGLIPVFDKPFMLKELGIFEEWFLSAYLGLNLTPGEQQLLQQSFNWLLQQVQQQPQVFIHRDYHSRNLMLMPNESVPKLAVIDFQDAMLGPITYDLVSLLKDCYIQWPREQVLQWVKAFHAQSLYQLPIDEFIRCFDLTGLQRHLKVLGVFCRLHLRDKKSNYLKDLPLTLQYTLNALADVPDLADFYEFMQEKVPALVVP